MSSPRLTSVISAESHDDVSFDDLSEPDVDFDLSFDEPHDSIPEEAVTMDGSLRPKYSMDDHEYSEYILGTLIVRLVSAKDLKPVINGFQQAGALFGKGKPNQLNQNYNRRNYQTSNSRRKMVMSGTSNPYATVVFGKQSERSRSVIDTLNPSWPRDEEFCFDVTLPVPKLSQSDEALQNGKASEVKESCTNMPIKPMLTFALWHEPVDLKSSKGDPPKKANYGIDLMETGSDDFLGICSIDVTSVITGKQPHLDDWFDLGGGEDIAGRVRLKIGYEPSDTPFRPGDSVRMTGFVNPLDLFPIPRNQIFRVDDVINEDEVIISYKTTEKWKCNFLAHRYMLISVKRHETALERYQEEILELSHRLSYSPAVDAVSQTITRLPEEGILFIGVEAAFRSVDLMGRWMNGGVRVIADDVIHATNLDGRHNPSVDDNISISTSSSHQFESFDNLNVNSEDDDLSIENEAKNGMPCCPISGLPMKDPVVAADGHTYERAAISRWLRESDTSPLTGERLPHKELAPNYLLISSFEESQNSKASEITQC